MRALGMFVAWLVLLTGCGPALEQEVKPKLVLFVGVDQSGSFDRAGYRKDALEFLSHYLYGHLNGQDGMDKPYSLFVGPIGGSKAGEPRTFHPIESFAGKDPAAIQQVLEGLFPAEAREARTDYDAFFRRVAEIVQERRLALRPISVVMATDGVPDAGLGKKGKKGLKGLDLAPLERLSRNVTLRLLYTQPESAAAWRRELPRRRVKVWTQDAEVMAGWKGQASLSEWIKGNVDFGVRAARVN